MSNFLLLKSRGSSGGNCLLNIDLIEAVGWDNHGDLVIFFKRYAQHDSNIQGLRANVGIDEHLAGNHDGKFIILKAADVKYTQKDDYIITVCQALNVARETGLGHLTDLHLANDYNARIEEIVAEILNERPELAGDNEAQIAEFEAVLVKRLKGEGISFCEREFRSRVTICDAWCAYHGDIAGGSCAFVYKRILDHRQSVRGPHAIRVVTDTP